MFARLVLPITVVLLVAAQAPAQDAKKELENLQGEWTVVSMEVAGKKSGDEAIKKMKPLVLKGSEWLAPVGGKFTFKIDPTKSPKELDLFSEAKGKEAMWRGIYKIDRSEEHTSELQSLRQLV